MSVTAAATARPVLVLAARVTSWAGLSGGAVRRRRDAQFPVNPLGTTAGAFRGFISLVSDELFKSALAFVALVLVDWHGFSLIGWVCPWFRLGGRLVWFGLGLA